MSTKAQTVKVRKENTAQAFASKSSSGTSVLPWALALILLGALALLYWRWHEQEDFLAKKIMELEKGKKKKPMVTEEEIEIVEVPEEGKEEERFKDFRPPEEKEKAVKREETREGKEKEVGESTENEMEVLGKMEEKGEKKEETPGKETETGKREMNAAGKKVTGKDMRGTDRVTAEAEKKVTMTKGEERKRGERERL